MLPQEIWTYKESSVSAVLNVTSTQRPQGKKKFSDISVYHNVDHSSFLLTITEGVVLHVWQRVNDEERV